MLKNRDLLNNNYSNVCAVLNIFKACSVNCNAKVISEPYLLTDETETVPSNNKIHGEFQLSVDDYPWEQEEKVETKRGVT